MKKLFSALAIALLLTLPASFAGALTLEDNQKIYTADLAAAWKAMDKAMLNELAGGMVGFLPPADQSKVLASATGAQMPAANSGQLMLVIVAVPYNMVGIDAAGLANIKNDIKNGSAMLINTAVNMMSSQVDYNLISKEALADGYLLEHKMGIMGESVNQVMSSRFSKNHMLIILGQYPGASDKNDNAAIMTAVKSVKITAANK